MAAFLTGALACATILSGCSPEPAVPPPTEPAVSPSAPTTSQQPTQAESTTVAASPEVTQSESPVAVPTEESTASLPPVEQPSPQGGPWTATDLTLRSGADTIRATDLPETFREFLTTRIGVEDEIGCTTQDVTIHGIHADGFVYGTEESTCTGGEAIWGITDNQWRYIVQFQDAMPCADLAYNEIPEGVPGLRCLGDDGSAQEY